MKYVLPVLFLSAALAFPQHLHLGAKGGVPFDDAYSAVSAGPSNFLKESARFAIGPMLDISLPAGLGVEFDILYKRRTFNAGALESSGRVFEFPLVAKYHFSKSRLSPYVGGGIAFRNLGEFSGLVKSSGSSNTGVVLEGGILAKLAIRASAEIRYTRWTGQSLYSLAQSPGNLLKSNQNQAEFLIGITF